MRAEVDDYVDTKLANFEVVLDKTSARSAAAGRSCSGRARARTTWRTTPVEPGHPFERGPRPALTSARWAPTAAFWPGRTVG